MNICFHDVMRTDFLTFFCHTFDIVRSRETVYVVHILVLYSYRREMYQEKLDLHSLCMVRNTVQNLTPKITVQ